MGLSVLASDRADLMSPPNSDFISALITIIFALISAIIGSTGLWMFLTKRFDNKSLHMKLTMGMAHNTILYAGMKHIRRGYITQEELENIHDYLWVPYSELGGNGSAKRMIDQLTKLPVKEFQKEDDCEDV
jgi:hypothetical protein